MSSLFDAPDANPALARDATQDADRMPAQLALYQSDFCFYCRIVQQEIEDLGLNVELRNARRDPDFARELRQNCGRSTVPVLKITFGDNSVQWLPESEDIIRYLRSLPAESTRRPL